PRGRRRVRAPRGASGPALRDGGLPQPRRALLLRGPLRGLRGARARVRRRGRRARHLQPWLRAQRVLRADGAAPRGRMKAPLEDVRVIAVEQFGAGPWSTLQLADLGAKVIKIEDPASNGDVGRYVPPFQEGEDSLFFETFNRNKWSVSLDLRDPAGREAFERLIQDADILFSNLRGDQPEKLRLRYDDLKHVNPRIVCCSLSGFGMTGPRAADG